MGDEMGEWDGDCVGAYLLARVSLQDGEINWEVVTLDLILTKRGIG